MQLDSTLSATARPFQPQAASPLALGDDIHRVYPAQNGLTRGSPTTGLTAGSPVRRHPSTTATPLMRKGYPLIPLSLGSPFIRGVGAGEIDVTRVVVTPIKLSPLEGDERKRMDSLVRSKSPNLGARRVILMMWPTLLGITSYHEYYEDSYLMPLVVSSLTGDTSDVFDWMRSVTPGGTQDLSMLLQMLREHYCGSFTFWEQRNMVENLC